MYPHVRTYLRIRLCSFSEWLLRILTHNLRTTGIIFSATWNSFRAAQQYFTFVSCLLSTPHMMIRNSLHLLFFLVLQATSTCKVSAFVCRSSKVSSFSKNICKHSGQSFCPATYRPSYSVGPLFNDYLDSLKGTSAEKEDTATGSTATETGTQDQVKIYVGNLPFDENKGNIRKLFEAFGEVSDVYLPFNGETGLGRGFGCVSMPDRSAAEKAIEKLNESSFGDRIIYVNIAGENKAKGGARRRKSKYSKVWVDRIELIWKFTFFLIVTSLPECNCLIRCTYSRQNQVVRRECLLRNTRR